MDMQEKRRILEKTFGGSRPEAVWFVIENAFEVAGSTVPLDSDTEENLAWNIIQAAIDDLRYAQNLVNL